MRKRRSPNVDSFAKAQRRARAVARAEAKMKRWRETHVYSERVYMRLAKRFRAVGQNVTRRGISNDLRVARFSFTHTTSLPTQTTTYP